MNAENLLASSECIEATLPGARWFIWRALPGHVHLLRTTFGAKARVTGSLRPVPLAAAELMLAELGLRKPADSMHWEPSNASLPRTIVGKLTPRLSQSIANP